MKTLTKLYSKQIIENNNSQTNQSLFMSFSMPSFKTLYFSLALSAKSFWFFSMSLQLSSNFTEALPISFIVSSLFLRKNLSYH